jgi:hypothetical protein
MSVSSRCVLAVAFVLAAATVGVAAPASTDATAGGLDERAPNESNATAGGALSNATAGETLSSAFATHGATLDGRLAVEEFLTRLDGAETPAERARAIARVVNRTRNRVVALERRLETLRTGRSNGSIDDGEFAVRAAPLVATARERRPLLAAVQSASEDVDAEVLEMAGVTRDGIAALDARLEAVAVASPRERVGDGVDGDFYRQIARVAATYNDRLAGRDLGVLGSYLDEERVNLRIRTGDGDAAVVSFRMTASNRVRDLRAGPHPGASVRVTMSESTARRLVDGDDPIEATSDAFLAGDIDVDGLGAYDALRWLAIDLVLDVVHVLNGFVNWLGSLLT